MLVVFSDILSAETLYYEYHYVLAFRYIRCGGGVGSGIVYWFVQLVKYVL